MKTTIHITAIACLCLMLSCKTANKDTSKIEYVNEPITEEQTRSDKIAVPDQKQRVKGEWIILNAGGKDIDAMDERAYIDFSPKEGRIYGFTGCNYINGSFNIENDNGIDFYNVITTTRHCDAVSDEHNILNAINAAATFSIYKKSDLYYMDLKDSAGTTVMHTKRHNADVLSGSWAVSSIHGKGITGNKLTLIIDIPELKLHGNLGCNIINGQIGLDRNKDWFIQFFNITSTNNNCGGETMNIERNLLIALEEVEYINRKNRNEAILCDKDKKEVLSLVRKKFDTGE